MAAHGVIRFAQNQRRIEDLTSASDMEGEKSVGIRLVYVIFIEMMSFFY